MSTWKVTLEALQPISIASYISADATWNTTNFIPGSTWRGAIAEHWKYTIGFHHPATDTFINDSIFRDAYQKGTAFQPIYFRQEKRKSFNQKSNPTVNLLESYLKDGIFITNRNGSAVIENWDTYESNIIKSTAIGTKMSRTRESVEQGKFYTMTSIAEGSIFETTAYIPEATMELMAPQKEITVYVGKKRFSGYGKTRITFEKQEAPFNKQAFYDLQQYIPSKDQIVVALSATSPVIIYDDFLRPASQVKWANHIRPFINTDLEELVPISETTWATSTVRDGWQQQWNAPKPTEQIFRPGATYIATFKKEDEAKLLRALEQILDQGIGERIQEGFGQFIIAPIGKIDLSSKNEMKISTKKQRFNNAKDKSFTVEEESKFLKLAQSLFESLTQKISLSQWHTLLNEQDLIEAITSTEATAYIERRIHSNVRNGWKSSGTSKKDGNGYLLRQYVQQIVDNEEDRNRAERAAKLFISFVARMQRMSENNAREHMYNDKF